MFHDDGADGFEQIFETCLYNHNHFGKNITEVIIVKDKVNQLFKDKIILVTLVLGLLTIVAAAGAVTIRKGNENLEESPYLEIKEPDGLIAETENGLVEGESVVAGNSNAEEDAYEAGVSGGNGTYVADSAAGVDANAGTSDSALEAGVVANESLVLNFTETDKLAWPVMGNVILGYSMDTTTWFPTLEQYKCNPANVIQSDVSMPVAAPADARVLEIGSNEEIGNYIRLDLGNEYTALCGQLKEIPVVENEYLNKGDLIGYIAEPTKYYSVEGVNLYFEFLHAGEPVDALDYLE